LCFRCNPIIYTYKNKHSHRTWARGVILGSCLGCRSDKLLSRHHPPLQENVGASSVLSLMNNTLLGGSPQRMRSLGFKWPESPFSIHVSFITIIQVLSRAAMSTCVIRNRVISSPISESKISHACCRPVASICCQCERLHRMVCLECTLILLRTSFIETILEAGGSRNSQITRLLSRRSCLFRCTHQTELTVHTYFTHSANAQLLSIHGHRDT